MAGSGVNLAVTKDGGTYNKLQRPQDYLMPTPIPSQRENATRLGASSPPSAGKRKHEHPATQPKHKRPKRGQEEDGTTPAWPGSKASRRTKFGIQVELPGLDGDCSSDEGIGEALAYLREVRSEASTLPDLLGASPTPAHDTNQSDQHTIYREGTWIAIDGECDSQYSEGSCDDDNGVVDSQDRLHQLLLKRFIHLRATLAGDLDGKSTTRMPKHGALMSGTCFEALDKEYPRPEQVVHLKASTVYAALKKCANNLDQVTVITPQSSCWIWTLLALVGEAGTLDNDKISRIRDVGQKAGLMGVRLREAGARQYHFYEDNGAGAHNIVGSTGSDDMSVSSEGIVAADSEEAIEVDQARARARLLTQLGERLVQPQLPVAELPLNTEEQRSESGGLEDGIDEHSDNGHNRGGDNLALCGPDLNTRVTIDMILTVVAECFGQRDLLKYRQRW